MQADIFFLDSAGERPVIRHRHYNAFAIELFNLATEAFAAPTDRLTMFGHINGHPVAFVSLQQRTRVREISNALTWYSESIGQDLQLTTIDPRPHGHLRVIR